MTQRVRLFGKRSQGKYRGEEEGSWCSYKVREGYRIRVWKTFSKGWDLVVMSLEYPLRWEIGRGWGFGKISDLGMNP